MRYAGVAESLVRHLKYRGWSHLARVCAQWMAGALDCIDLEALVPVPLHPVRQRARGYNQARLIATALGEIIAVPVIDSLDRVRATRSQVGLGRAERAANVEDAFVCRRTPPARVALVDDVTTSGATMVACARAIMDAGARRVVGVAFALAPEDTDR